MREAFKKMLFYLLLCCAWTGAPVFGDESAEMIGSDGLLSVSIAPAIDYPIEVGAKKLFAVGGSANLIGRIPIPALPSVSINGGITYSYVPIRAETSLSMGTVGLGLGYRVDITPRLFFHIDALGGGYYGLFNTLVKDEEGIPYEEQGGGGVYATLDTGVSVYLTPWFSIGLSLGYKEYFALERSVAATLVPRIHVSGMRQQVRFRDPRMTNIFPALAPYYANHPIGSVIVVNRERFPIENVEISVFVKSYMDSPKVCAILESLAPGAERTVDITVLLSEEVHAITESVQVPLEIRADYTLNGRRRELVRTEPVRFQSRNAITWDDDRKAAAFVSTTEPRVLLLAKSVARMVAAKKSQTVSRNLKMGLAFFEALSVHGLEYIVDPNLPSFEETSTKASIVDFLQYPSQTLEYRGGDCDDLTILYCALLESVGIKTAFLTVPGHILPAFSLDMTPNVAARSFANSELFIYRDDTTWVPVEVTTVGGSFLDAWEIGAEAWNRYEGEDATGFFELSECWKTYHAVLMPDSENDPDMPSLYDVEEAYVEEMARLSERELAPLVAKLMEEIEKREKPVRHLNRLGVLYARYGMIDSAMETFMEVLQYEEALPALANLGNIHFLQDSFEAALEFYRRAETIQPDRASIVLAIARTQHKLANHADATMYLDRLKELDPWLAAKYAYIGTVEANVTRADSTESNSSDVLWEDE
jgi:hypothetical protein